MIDSPFHINEIVDSPSKLAILRIFCSRKGFKATGREIAKLCGYSVPATHESLKNLNSRNILNLEVIGKQHIYTLNEEDRFVRKVIRPLFESEGNIKDEIRDFLLKELKSAGVKQKIVSLIFYGSAQRNEAGKNSDADVFVVVKKSVDVKSVSDVFVSVVMGKFKSYFGIQLDPYIKSAADFRSQLKKNLPPVSTLMKSYIVLYGKEPLEV
ncbi:MAG TPA: nucleotidyltransferase domain-containing protein [Candidatus Omnitrophota bacterium]|nr:nucleotidyltransferase domain-containing protein [Candidatus Omnitrophota bacterium]